MVQVENFCKKMTEGIYGVPQSGYQMAETQIPYPRILNVLQHKLPYAIYLPEHCTCACMHA